ncbi:MAG: protein kinase [Bifidobacteriaceae bacterium]|jgi:serine/threonine protein kinase|nr:protein kinase [Bifidobacteriaceae bacterium]
MTQLPPDPNSPPEPGPGQPAQGPNPGAGDGANPEETWRTGAVAKQGKIPREDDEAAGRDRSGPDRTRREGDGMGEGKTRREGDGTAAGGRGAPGRTRREGDGAGPRRTRREGDGPPAAPRGQQRFGLPPSVAERYEYVRALSSEGAEGDVVLIRERATGAEAAIKLYRSARAELDGDALEAIGRARVPHVVRMVEFGSWDGLPWEIEEYCPLGTLGDLVRRRGGSLGEAEVAEVARQLGETLDQVHALGVVHRDLKPSNILVRAEEPRLDLALADFGTVVAQQQLSFEVRSMAGTWGYAAPEVRHNVVAPASDWWALGAIVYELAAGRSLFSGEGGRPLSEVQIIATVGENRYSTKALAPMERVRLLADGLLTYDREHRWAWPQVREWLDGGSPRVHRGRPAAGRAAGPGTGLSLSILGELVDGPAALAELLRRRPQEAGDLLARPPSTELKAWLAHFAAGRDAVTVFELGGTPGVLLIRLQAVLDPDGPLGFHGVELSTEELRRQIEAAGGAGPAAVEAGRWLEALVKEHALGAWAQITGSEQAARADQRLGEWFARFDEALGSGVPEVVRTELTRDGAAPKLAAFQAAFGDPAEAVASARREAAAYAGDTDWARSLAARVAKAPETDVGLFLAARSAIAAARAQDERRERAERRLLGAADRGRRRRLAPWGLVWRSAAALAYVLVLPLLFHLDGWDGAWMALSARYVLGPSVLALAASATVSWFWGGRRSSVWVCAAACGLWFGLVPAAGALSADADPSPAQVMKVMGQLPLWLAGGMFTGALASQWLGRRRQSGGGAGAALTWTGTAGVALVGVALARVGPAIAVDSSRDAAVEAMRAARPAWLAGLWAVLVEPAGAAGPWFVCWLAGAAALAMILHGFGVDLVPAAPRWARTLRVAAWTLTGVVVAVWGASAGVVGVAAARGWSQVAVYLGLAAAIFLMVAGAAADVREDVRERAERESRS